MKLTKRIKEQIKRTPTKKVKELPNEFYNKMAVYCLDNDLHMKTIYSLCKVKHIDQMLNTMYESTIKDYELHIPTIDKIRDTATRAQINDKLAVIKLKLPVI